MGEICIFVKQGRGRMGRMVGGLYLFVCQKKSENIYNYNTHISVLYNPFFVHLIQYILSIYI